MGFEFTYEANSLSRYTNILLVPPCFKTENIIHHFNEKTFLDIYTFFYLQESERKIQI